MFAVQKPRSEGSIATLRYRKKIAPKIIWKFLSILKQRNFWCLGGSVWTLQLKQLQINRTPFLKTTVQDNWIWCLAINLQSKCYNKSNGTGQQSMIQASSLNKTPLHSQSPLVLTPYYFLNKTALVRVLKSCEKSSLSGLEENKKYELDVIFRFWRIHSNSTRD